MSLPSSPRSECSTLSEYEFVADPEVVKMLPATGQPTDMGLNSTLPDFRLIASRMRFSTRAVCAQRMGGSCKGEYVAECATGNCGYLLNLERFIGRAHVPSAYYPARYNLRDMRVHHLTYVGQ
ncbi:hypothetical protein P692DRAFT_201811228 [Suillus brevipes Sb2]|nr:hypothetical protein P692DRAFT_201811228 [Suillus brevipes Sb2]